VPDSIPKVEAFIKKLKNENVAFLGINLENDAKSTQEIRRGAKYEVYHTYRRRKKPRAASA